jgi:exonuclease VII small subunit
MRRVAAAVLGGLEVLVAIALLLLGLRLPTEPDVRQNFAHARQVTGGTESQVRVMRDQVADLRKQDFPRRAEQLREHTKTMADSASDRQVDFKTVDAIAKSLGEVSKGLTTWADTIDAEQMKKVSAGLGTTAGFLEINVADASEKSAADLEKTLAAMERDSGRLATLLRQAPPDLKAAKAVHDGLGNFDAGLDRLDQLWKPERLQAMKEGFEGMETALGSTADQVDKVSGLSYPVVTFNGLKPNVETKAFWPDADKVSAGLRKATKGVQAANQELVLMDKSLPDLRKSMAESRKSVAQTRASLAVALKQQAETEKLLKAVPEQTAALAESLPKLGGTLLQMLRETKKLRELAAGLRAARTTLDESLKAWPEVAKGLKKSAVVLDDARKQLEFAANNREDYERAMTSSSRVARSFADLLPAFTDQLDSRLAQQESALGKMETGLSEVNAALPVMEDKAAELIRTVKWLVYLVAALVIAHAAYVLADAARGITAKPQAS